MGAAQVMAIFFLQIGLTVGAAFAFLQLPDLGGFVDDYPWSIAAVWLGLFVFMGILSCSPCLTRMWPWNLVCLLSLTVIEGIAIALTTFVIHPFVTIVALVATGVSAVFAFGLSFLPTLATSRLWSIVASLLAIATTFGCVVGLQIVTQVGSLVGGAFFAIVFSIFVAWDMSSILTGSHYVFQFQLDEPILAALCLYTDVVGMFLYSLSCIAGAVMGKGS
jgi:uncharacterized protein (DUF697 family)